MITTLTCGCQPIEWLIERDTLYVEREVKMNEGDKAYTAQPIYLSDLNNCQPLSVLSNETRQGLWRQLEYEADALSGVMLVAGTETGAPPITYPLRFSGWYAVSI